MSELEKQRFVERNHQMEAFEAILKNPRGEKRICAIIGPGGIGKTWLMRAMMEKARRRRPAMHVPEALIDMYSTDHRYLEGVMDAVVAQLRSFTGPSAFVEYEKERPELDAMRAQLAGLQNASVKSFVTEDHVQKAIDTKLRTLTKAFRVCLVRTTRRRAVVLAFDTFENVQEGPVGQWILDPQGLQMPGLVCIVASRRAWAKDQREVAGLTDEQALEFYHRHMKGEELITPESAGQELVTDEPRTEIAILNAKVGGNPLLLGLAIIWWLGDPAALVRLDELSMEEFKKHIILFFRSMGGGLLQLGNLKLDETMYQTLVMISVMNRRFDRFFLERLIAHKYIKSGSAAGVQIWRKLQEPHFFFVKQRPEGEVQLHDVLAEMLREHLLADVLGDEMGAEPSERWQALTRDIACWYDNLIAQSTPAAGDILRSEKLGYVFQLDVPASRQRSDAAQALKLLLEYERMHSDVLDRLVVADFTRKADGASPGSGTQQADRMLVDLAVQRFSAKDKYEVCRALGEMGARVRMFDQSAKCWERAAEAAGQMDSPDRYERHIRALLGQHNSTWPDHPDQCLPIVDRALALCEEAPGLRAEVLYEKGFAYCQLQDLGQAIGWYEKAREAGEARVDPVLMGTVFNDMGYEYSRLGDSKTADAHLNTALELREARLRTIDERIARIEEMNVERPAELEKQRHDARMRLGWTHNTMGEVARYNGMSRTAEKAYTRAYNIFVEERDPFWQARALFSRGEANRRYAVKLCRENDLEYKTRERRAKRDMDDGLELCRRFGLTQISATAHRRRGRLPHDQALRTNDLQIRLKLLRQALGHFEAGLKFAVDSGDMLEELENLTEIAFLADDFADARFPNGCPDPHLLEQEYGYIERLRSALAEKCQQASEGRPLIFQFHVFENLLDIELGAYYFVLRDFDESLRHYLTGYAGLAADPGYGSARYKMHIDHLFGNVTKLAELAGPDQAREWCRQFVTAFRNGRMQRQDETIAEAHPDFVTAFENHRSTVGVFQRVVD